MPLNQNPQVEEEVVQFRNDTAEDYEGPGETESPGKKGKGKGKKGKKGKGKAKAGKNPPPQLLNEEALHTAGEEAFEAAPRDVSPTKKGAKGKKGTKQKDEADDAKAYLTDMKETGQNFQQRGESGAASRTSIMTDKVHDDMLDDSATKLRPDEDDEAEQLDHYGN